MQLNFTCNSENTQSFCQLLNSTEALLSLWWERYFPICFQCYMRRVGRSISPDAPVLDPETATKVPFVLLNGARWNGIKPCTPEHENERHKKPQMVLTAKKVSTCWTTKRQSLQCKPLRLMYPSWHAGDVSRTLSNAFRCSRKQWTQMKRKLFPTVRSTNQDLLFIHKVSKYKGYAR